MIAGWMALGAAWAAPLGRLVDRELADPALAGAVVSVRVDNHRHRRLVDHGGALRVIPASTVKWITAIAAADGLGLDHRFRTRVAVSGLLDGDVLVGDVVVIGDGDPSLGLESPEALLAEIAGTLLDAGIREVTGRVIVADDVFGDGPLGAGWMWDDLRFAFSAPFGSVNLGHNLPQPGLRVCELIDGPGTPVKDPDLCAAQALDATLRQAGLRIGGEPALAPRPDEVLTDLVVWESAPLRELLAVMLQDSDNLYAECIVRALDRDGVRTFRGARDELDRILDAAGVADAGTNLADGSGLSRYAFVSARALVAVTAWGLEQDFGDDLGELLAVLGRSGTLQQRGLDTPAEGRVWAKTGSMSGVRNIVGVTHDQRGRDVRFAILFNGLTVDRSVALELQDRILALLAVSRGRSVRRKDRIAVLGGGG